MERKRATFRLRPGVDDGRGRSLQPIVHQKSKLICTAASKLTLHLPLVGVVGVVEGEGLRPLKPGEGLRPLAPGEGLIPLGPGLEVVELRPGTLATKEHKMNMLTLGKVQACALHKLENKIQ